MFLDAGIGTATVRRQWQTFLVRLPALDAVSSAAFLEELCPVSPSDQKLSSLLKRLFIRPWGVPPQTWRPVAVAHILLAALCVLPFVRILEGSAGSPQFFSFALHVAVVTMYLPRASSLLRARRIPIRVHAVVASLWCLSRMLKWNALERLPFAICVMSCNMQVPFGLAIQAGLFGRRYSPSQLAGVTLVIVGIAWSGHAMQPTVQSSRPRDFWLGVLEILAASFCFAAQSSIMKLACARFGGTIQENVFITHACALCFVFPFQWEKVRPHVEFCLSTRDHWLSANLALGVLLHFAARSSAALLARRTPNLLAAQAVQALGGCSQMLVAGLASTCPLPGRAWLGVLAVGLGMLHYLRASDCAEASCHAGDRQEADRLLPPGLQTPGLHAAWAVATTGAKRGREDAARVENFAWRRMWLRRSRRDWSAPLSQRCAIELPGIDRCISLEDLNPVCLEEERLPCLVQRACKFREEDSQSQFLRLALASIAVGCACVLPYSNLLEADPGSPLSFSFVLHVVVIVTYLPRARSLIYERKIPMRYHAAMALLWCLFTTLRSDAYSRLPTSVCMLVSNSRMLVGLVVQFALFGKHYSASQITGAGIVTVGIVWAGNAMQSAAAARSDSTAGASNFAIGILGVLGSTFALALQSSVIKVAFSRFGECVEEQVFFVHLCALFVVFPSQWHLVGPRLVSWATEPSPWLLLNLLAAVLLNFASRSVDTRLAGRAPNLLLMQLVQTVDGFLQLLIAALLRVPPWPPSGFWGGALVLLLGTLQYLRASGAPPAPGPSGELAKEVLGREDWAVATVEARRGSSKEAARRENLAWRKMAMKKGT